MKRLMAIFFLFNFLCVNTALGEILKLPLLIHHYYEHIHENGEETIVDFLAQHYKGDIEHHHQDKHNDHERLPFKTLNDLIAQVISLIPQQMLSITRIIYEEADIKLSTNYHQNYTNTYINSIWQPPRFC